MKSDSNGAYKGCEGGNESESNEVASDLSRKCSEKESKVSNEIYIDSSRSKGDNESKVSKVTNDSGKGINKSICVSELSKKFGGQNKYIKRKNVKFDPKSPKTVIKSDKKKCKEIKMKLEGLYNNKNDKKCKVESPFNKKVKTNKVTKLVEAFNENVNVKDSAEFKHKNEIEVLENVKSDKKDVKNAFKIMMESRIGVESDNITPQRKIPKKRLVSTDGQKVLQEWLRLKRK